MILVPANYFKGLENVTKETESFFEFVTSYVITLFIENLDHDKWALKFPETLDNEGRRIIHDIADSFELAHHSEGKSTRRALIYPRSQFKEKQETERRKMEKEVKKIRE